MQQLSINKFKKWFCWPIHDSGRYRMTAGIFFCSPAVVKSRQTQTLCHSVPTEKPYPCIYCLLPGGDSFVQWNTVVIRSQLQAYTGWHFAPLNSSVFSLWTRLGCVCSRYRTQFDGITCEDEKLVMICSKVKHVLYWLIIQYIHIDYFFQQYRPLVEATALWGL